MNHDAPAHRSNRPPKDSLKKRTTRAAATVALIGQHLTKHGQVMRSWTHWTDDHKHITLYLFFDLGADVPLIAKEILKEFWFTAKFEVVSGFIQVKIQFD